MQFRLLPILCAASLSVLGTDVYGQLRIVSLNASNSGSATAGPRTGMSTILSAIGSSISDDPTLAGNTGIVRPIDVLALQEVYSASTTGAGYAALLNSIYGTTRYRYATLNGATTGAGTQGLVYNSETVELIGSTAIGTASTSGAARQPLRYQLRPVGYGAAADTYLYNSHFKSADDSTSANRRNVEAQAIRSNADALPAGTNIIYLGDLNVYRSSEAMYQTLTQTAGNGKAYDPINKPTWTGSGNRNVQTQSPFDASLNSGFSGTSGGMDDRFDQQLISSSLNDASGVAYIPNSYQAFGNNGSHAYDQPINSGSGASPAVLNALAGILDHLPVVADYQLPARMAATLVNPPTQVIVGAAASATLNVSNSAPVAIAIGADELAFSYSSAGALTGTGTGTVAALASPAARTVQFVTSTPGLKSGTLSVSSSSQAVANGTFSQAISTTVLAHANPSFATTADVNVATIDLGIRAQGLTASEAGLIANLADASGFTAKLDLDSITPAGGLGGATISIATFSHLSAAGSVSFQAALNTTTLGSKSAYYTLAFSDEDLPGAAALGSLQLYVQGQVALGGDADLNDRVDTRDFNLLSGHFGESSGTWTDGDFNRDGLVSSADFGMLAANYGQSGLSLGAIVPEPCSAAVFTFIALLITRRRG